MLSPSRNFLLAALPLLVWFSVVVGAASHNKIPLKSIKTLTFSSDKMTTARRSSPIPQLSCVGPACNRYSHYVTVVQCTNMGDDGSGSVQWKCQSDLPSSLRLGKVEVSCEGWNKPGDSNVLQGSCGLEYNLIKDPSGGDGSNDLPGPPTDFGSIAFQILWFSVLAFILYQVFSSCFAQNRTRVSPSSGGPGGPGGGGGGPSFWSGGGGGGGGGGPGDNNNPPPPYTPDSNTKPSTSTAGGGIPTGFLAGLGAGGLAAYLAGRNRNNQQQQQQPRGYRYGGFGFEDQNDDVLGRDRRWGGGGDGVAGPSRGRGTRGGGGSSVNDGLGATRSSTGFGGSSVR